MNNGEYRIPSEDEDFPHNELPNGSDHFPYLPPDSNTAFSDRGHPPNGQVVIQNVAKNGADDMARLVSQSNQAWEMPFTVNAAPPRGPIEPWNPYPFELVPTDQIEYGGTIRPVPMFTRDLPAGMPTEADMDAFARNVLPNFHLPPNTPLKEVGVPRSTQFVDSRGPAMRRNQNLDGLLDSLVETAGSILGTTGIINEKTIDTASKLAVDQYLAKQQQELLDKRLEAENAALAAEQTRLATLQTAAQIEKEQLALAHASTPIYKKGWFIPAVVIGAFGIGYFALAR